MVHKMIFTAMLSVLLNGFDYYLLLYLQQCEEELIFGNFVS